MKLFELLTRLRKIEERYIGHVGDGVRDRLALSLAQEIIDDAALDALLPPTPQTVVQVAPHMTPFELGIILHYNSSDTTPDEFWTPIGEKTFQDLVDNGLLKQGVQSWESEKLGTSRLPRFMATDRLKAFVAVLCETPLPYMQWVHPFTGTKLSLGIGGIQRPS